MLKRQLKAARALMGWTQEDFAAVSGVSIPTIRRIECGDGELVASPEVLWKIEGTLNEHGILIQSQDDEAGVGVRLLWPDATYAERRKMQARQVLHTALASIPEDQRREEMEHIIRTLVSDGRGQSPQRPLPPSVTTGEPS